LGIEQNSRPYIAMREHAMECEVVQNPKRWLYMTKKGCARTNHTGDNTEICHSIDKATKAKLLFRYDVNRIYFDFATINDNIINNHLVKPQKHHNMKSHRNC
jgi:hypothetical protein